MSFLNPLMLLGVGAAVLPLVLHLLSRSRYRTIDWGGMLFLAMPGDARQRRSARLHRWLLLALRMAIVAALAVALARPVLRGRFGAGAAGGRLAAAVVLDCSASMAFEENGTPRIDLARGAARQVLEALEPGDSAALVLAGADPAPGQSAASAAAAANTLPLTSDLQAVADRVALARAGGGRADFAASIRTAIELLRRAGPDARTDVYVICDRQKLSWQAARDPAFAAMWREHNASAHAARLMIVPVGSTDAHNVAVESLELLNAPAIRGQPAEVEVRLRNYGPVQRAGLPLTIKVNGQPAHQAKVDLAPDTSTSVKAPVTFDRSGSYVVTASVRSAGMEADDSLDAAVEAVDPVKVLIVSGDQRPAAFRSESDFLRVALAPFAAGRRGGGDDDGGRDRGRGRGGEDDRGGGGDASVVRVIPVEKWSDVQLGDYQVVVLANVEWLATAQVKALEQYVYERGGGLLITPGNLTRAEDYNQLFYRFGAGLLPAEMQQPTPADGSQATSLLGYRSEHPIFQFLRSRPGLLPSATVGRYFPVAATGGEGYSLAEYLSGDSFLVEKPFGKGRVLLMTTTVDADWNTLPLSNFFLPFAQSAVRYLAAESGLQSNVRPSVPIRLAFRDDVEGRTVRLKLPDDTTVDLPILRYTSQPEVRYDATDRPGRYTMTIREGRAERVQHFVVARSAADAQESNLARMEDEDWQDLERDLGARRVEPGRVPIASELTGSRAGVELWGAGLGLVMLLSVLELLVGRAAARELS